MSRFIKRGFTLIELILSIAIASILIMVLSGIFNLNLKILSQYYSKEKEYKEAYTAMVYIENTIRRSYKINEENIGFENRYIGEVFNNSSSSYKLNNKFEENEKNTRTEYFFQINKAYNKLRIVRNNLDNNTRDYGIANNIAKCKQVKIDWASTGNKNNTLLEIEITSINNNFTLRTLIDIGDKL